MSRNLRMYYYTILGAMGGLTGTQLFDTIGFLRQPGVFASDLRLGAALGLAIGFLLGLAEGILSKSILRGLRSALFGGVIGLLAGAVALPFSEFVFLRLGGSSLSRIAGWAVFGAVMGLSDTLTSRSQTWKGVLGGLIGGGIGGALLELALDYFSQPMIGKISGLMLLGASIGIFTALIVVALSRAWLDVQTGKLQGTEFILDKFMREDGPAAIIGSNTLKSDIALPDPLVAPQHALLKGAGTYFSLRDRSTEGTYVNGKAIEVHNLRHGDTIRLGKTELVYREKRT